MNTRPPDYDRVMELLAGRAMNDLDSMESGELDTLLARMSPEEARLMRDEQTQLEGLKGATLAGWSNADSKTGISPALRARILSQGPAAQSGSPSSVPIDSAFDPASGSSSGFRPVATSMRLREKFAWLTAAASIALAVFAWNRPIGSATTEPAWQARAQLVKDADSKLVSWSATDDPTAKGVSGDIVWNADQQRGYMRFKGLAPNDPRLQQYQLWIFDKGREGEFPVDGGVFDISAASKDPATGDLVVPIAPKLAVRDPALFAVTIEMPGGVVVTKKERLLLLAKADEAK
jgi:hypothetical protein